MITRQGHRRDFLRFMLAAAVLPVRGIADQSQATAGYHVHPKDWIQDALDAAARDPVNKTVYVHAGTYAPRAKGQALVWFNARHDGITLQAVGDVILTAGNPELADAHAHS